MTDKASTARKLRVARYKRKYAHIDWERVRERCQQEVLLQRHALFGHPIKVFPDNAGCTDEV